MSQIWQMATIIQFFDGMEVRPRMQSYESKEAADDALKRIGAEMKAMLNQGLVGVPDAEGNSMAAMPVMQFLGQLGIKGVGHGMYNYEVHGSLIIPGRPSLVIAH
jgi:hypothetical protein